MSFEIPMKDIRDKLDLRKPIVARAMVTDEATVLTMAAETTLNIKVDSESITIKRWDKRNQFVPGITYFASVSIFGYYHSCSDKAWICVFNYSFCYYNSILKLNI